MTAVRVLVKARATPGRWHRQRPEISGLQTESLKPADVPRWALPQPGKTHLSRFFPALASFLVPDTVKYLFRPLPVRKTGHGAAPESGKTIPVGG